MTLGVLLIPIYLVHTIYAMDAWVSAIILIQTAVALIGYFYGGVRRGCVACFMPLWTAFGLTLYPAMVATTGYVEMLVGLADIF